jgi:hypothetical protein
MENLWIQIDSQNGYTKQVRSFFWLINTFVANLQLWKKFLFQIQGLIKKKTYYPIYNMLHFSIEKFNWATKTWKLV